MEHIDLEDWPGRWQRLQQRNRDDIRICLSQLAVYALVMFLGPRLIIHTILFLIGHVI